MNTDWSRRRFLRTLCALPLLPGCERLARRDLPVSVLWAGMEAGHALRDGAPLPLPRETLETGVLILGSGVAGSACAWKLAREGRRDFILLAGPEAGGNAAAGEFGELRFPRGAHYLPLPSLESAHVRELLADMGVLQAGVGDLRPWYDEACVVHAPAERLLIDRRWQEDLLPHAPAGSDEARDQARFLQSMEQFKQAQGSDGRRAFAVPLALSSTDADLRGLDQLSFAAWLDRENFRAPGLRWYLDYACRDDYGAPAAGVSAWAGIAYFAGRAGQAADAQPGAVLTWPDGLNPLLRHMHEVGVGAAGGRWLAGHALRAVERGNRMEVLCADGQGGAFLVRARRVVCAMPLMVATRVLPDMAALGFDPARDLPQYAPWLVANFLLEGFPAEMPGAELAWDNVIYGGQGLGYVVSTHQQLRVARPPQTVFTAYVALSDQAPAAVRRRLLSLDAQQLLDEVLCDLRLAYTPIALWRHVRAVEITVRGHAMPIPLPGFLSNPGRLALRGADDRLLFAHGDLSCLSVFEEAAWWGYRAALKLLA
ncbi:MAG: NAD(P)-binding protein [Rhodocyclaceae bacterium]|nr:NAD(P)-binding protein [Rhodocyclaceae bacterium]